MLSYRHAFHAGNHADVLKHIVLLALIDYLKLKDKAFSYIDTHAGAGLYHLDEAYAQKNAEFNTGITRLWQQDDLPELIANYVDLIKTFNADSLRHYPGSPFIAHALLRNIDNLQLFELHSTESDLLQQNCLSLQAINKSHVTMLKTDGLAALLKALPPKTRRGLVLVDPSYEEKIDYIQVVNVLNKALKLFPSGVYALWYPLLNRADIAVMLKSLKQLPAKSYCNISLQVKDRELNSGLYGSGMFILNPPWTLEKSLQPVLEYLKQILADDASADYVLEYIEN